MPSHKAWAGLRPSQPGAHFKGSVLTGRDQIKLSCEGEECLMGGRGAIPWMLLQKTEAFFEIRVLRGKKRTS